MTGRATLLAALVALSGGTHAAPAVPAGTCTVTLAKAHVFTGERFEVRDLAVRYGRLVAAAVAIASLAVPALARKPASAPTKTLMTRVDDRLKFDIDLTFPLEQFVRIYTYSEDK